MLNRSIAIDHAYKMLPSVGSIMLLHCDTVLYHSKIFISSEVVAVFHGKKRGKAFTILIFIVFVVIILIFSRASRKAHQGPKIRSAIHGRGIDLQKLGFQAGEIYSNQWLGSSFFFLNPLLNGRILANHWS